MEPHDPIHAAAVQIAQDGLTLPRARKRNHNPGFTLVQFQLGAAAGSREDPEPDGFTATETALHLTNTELLKAFRQAQRLIQLGYITPKEANHA